MEKSMLRKPPLLVLALFFVLVYLVRAAQAESVFRVEAGIRQLFLDNVDIESIEDLVRTMHPPSKKGAVIRPNWHLGVHAVQLRTAPVWDPEERIYKLWDTAATPPGLSKTGIGCTGYYESQDGLHWSQPALGQIEFDLWPKNNYILLLRGDGRTSRNDYVAYDPHDPDPSRRYKSAHPPHGFAVSPDGRRWRWLDGITGIPSGDEANFSIDHTKRLYILTVKRTGPNGRSVYLATSEDFVSWTEQGLIFNADDHDQAIGKEAIKARFADPTRQQLVANDPSRYNVDVYNMGVFRYESLYIGTPTMYYATGPSKDNTNTDGFHTVQLTSSRDLKKWERHGNRRPFIDNSRTESGAYDLTGIIGPSNAVVRGEELWFYYTSGKYRRTPPRTDPDHLAISLAVLRRDGFVSLDAGSKGGKVVTKSFTAPAGRLFVNVYAPHGKLNVAALDVDGNVLARSKSITGDLARHEVTWRQGKLTAGSQAQLQFQLENGEFYSYWIE